MRPDTQKTHEFYDNNAQKYFEQTMSLDIDRSCFTNRTPANNADCRVLDAGCGSGRDALAFSKMGYKVDAFDASPELVSLARKHTGILVAVCRFQDFSMPAVYNGIWASASLLHVPKEDLPGVVNRLVNALVPGGVLFATFKYGTEDLVDTRGRFFHNVTEHTGLEAFQNNPDITFTTEVVDGGSSGGEKTSWVNVIATKN